MRTHNKAQIVEMIINEIPQREIERQVGASRPYIRQISRDIGYQFPRNGVEVRGTMCICNSCGAFFFRPKSKIDRAEKNFCSLSCKSQMMRGANHPSWKDGSSARSWSSYVLNQAGYKHWKAAVLEKFNYRCDITGRKTNLECHHIKPKAENESPELAFDVNNGIVLCKEIHTEIHQMMDKDIPGEEAIEILREKYKSEKVRNIMSALEIEDIKNNEEEIP
jgi:hypothetical protein